ncbi:hypothetical protein DH2020_019285 [Rehmannia glutinosa]|uniref:Transmembrane protein n=1 Tax=Rehmannia glutinosa TaxID=99300 RepID=A0ABR0WLD8_REHGL
MDGYDSIVQEKLDAVMPWIGMYIASASAICTLAMAADLLYGFKRKKLWFPCKYSATSLTLLAVAMKIPMDLNTNMLHSADLLAKLGSLVFMSTAMVNFMSSLGSMNDKELLANIVALGILVITIVANVLIQHIQLRQIPKYVGVVLLPTISVMLLLVTFVSLAITIPTTKRRLESKYQEKHRVALTEEEVVQRRESTSFKNQRQKMMKYWVMAETSNPQFVMARSVICTTSTLIPLLPAIMLATSHIKLIMWFKDLSFGTAASVYGGYTRWIIVIQSIGVVVGTIAPTLRWFIDVGFKYSTTNYYNVRDEFRIETYWIQTLVDWRDNFSSLQIRQDKCTKCLHDAEWFILTFCIGVQILIVLISKLVVFICALLMSPFFLCFGRVNKFLMWLLSKVMTSDNNGNDQLGDETDINLSSYLLLLEGEAELPRRILKDIVRRADNTIQTGLKKQPESLINLLTKFVGFNGVGEFDSNQIPSLHSYEPPNCWTLPVVTLTSIAVALPNIAKDKKDQLVSSVGEGLSLAKIVEKTFNTNAQLWNIKKAADVSWVRVALCRKWLDMDLRKTSLKVKTSKEVLQKLSNKAGRTIMEFKREVKDAHMENPLNWPVKVVAANSMYRISRTILLSCEAEDEVTDEGLFERLSVMIADILAACLTNLPRVITTMCHRNAIEKREESVHEAFLLLGKTEQILQLLQQQECWPSLDYDKAAYIDEWRAFFCPGGDDDPAVQLQVII